MSSREARWRILRGAMRDVGSRRSAWVVVRDVAHGFHCLERHAAALDEPVQFSLTVGGDLDASDAAAIVPELLNFGGPRASVLLRGPGAAVRRTVAAVSTAPDAFCGERDGPGGDAIDDTASVRLTTRVSGAGCEALPKERLRPCYRRVRYRLPGAASEVHVWERSVAAVAADVLLGKPTHGVDNTGARLRHRPLCA